MLLSPARWLQSSETHPNSLIFALIVIIMSIWRPPMHYEIFFSIWHFLPFGQIIIFSTLLSPPPLLNLCYGLMWETNEKCRVFHFLIFLVKLDGQCSFATLLTGLCLVDNCLRFNLYWKNGRGLFHTLG
jgi:hypothetical protein